MFFALALILGASTGWAQAALPAGMAFAPILAGEFMMGCSHEHGSVPVYGDQHRVVLTHDFEMQTTEVTRGQWREVMGWVTHSVYTSYPLGSRHPVSGENRVQVAEFFHRLNALANDGYVYRLPTEAEWEYAARAGSTREEYVTELSELRRIAYFRDNSGNRLHEVGELLPNAWGLYDMFGNVWEMVEDSWRARFGPETRVDPLIRNLSSRRVIRGGGAFDPNFSLSVSKRWYDSGYVGDDLGFRVVRTRL